MPIDPDSLVIGVDLGGTNMQVAVVQFGEKGHSILGRHWCKTKASEGRDAVLDRIVAGIDSACAEAGVTRDRIAAAGIAAPGAIDIPTGIVLEAPNLGWENEPLHDIMAERLGVSITIDNDVNAAVWAEQQLGAGRGHSDLLGVWVGTGVGGALVIDDALYYGPYYTAGEIGHTVITPDDRPGKRTVEDLCSRSGMSNLIDARIREFQKSILHYRCEAEEELEPIEMSQFIAALKEDDPLVKRTVHRAAKMLGVAIANWVTVLSLDCVVIGGGVVEAFGKPFLARVGASFNSNVFPDRLKACKLQMTHLAGDAGLLGAALLAADEEEEE